MDSTGFLCGLEERIWAKYPTYHLAHSCLPVPGPMWSSNTVIYSPAPPLHLPFSIFLPTGPTLQFSDTLECMLVVWLQAPSSFEKALRNSSLPFFPEVMITPVLLPEVK